MAVAMVTSFLPAASPKALKAIRQTIRRWALHHRTDKSLEDLARMFRSVHPRLDQLLQPLLQVGIDPDSASYRCFPAPLGPQQVQAAAPAAQRAQESGWRGSSAPLPISLLIGVFCMRMAEHREPYDLRVSRTVLGARGGEIPPRDSPLCVNAHPSAGARW